jgi:hypothetical protein
MWQEQLKKIKKVLGMDTAPEKKTKPEITYRSIVRSNDEKIKNEKINKNYKKKTTSTSKPIPKKAKYNPSPLIGKPDPVSSKLGAKKTNTHEFKLNIDEFKRPNRDTCSMFLKLDIEQDISKHFPSSNNQYIGTNRQELVIGLDFGTAFTKVIIGEVTYAHAISFGKHGNLLPSKLYVNSKGRCFLDANKGELVLTDLKLPLLLENSSKVDHVAIVSFLALVFRECRLWSTQSIYKEFTIDWLVNVGLPTESYHNTSLSTIYRQLISASWALSFNDAITIQLAGLVLEEFQSSSCKIPDNYILSHDVINLFPEFAAQIVGYVQSPSRREYSHLLIDVGAGTLDVAMFIVTNDDGEWLFQTTGKDIKALGADILAKHRISNGKVSIETDLINSQLDDKDIAKAIGVSLSELLEIDKPFSQAVNSSFCQVVSSIAGGYKFSEPITTFICGGGSNVKLYGKQVATVGKGYPLKIISIPVPERLRSEGITLSNYHRLSVAYGLSYDPFDIGVVTQKKVDIKPQQRAEWEPSDYLLYPDR